MEAFIPLLIIMLIGAIPAVIIMRKINQKKIDAVTAKHNDKIAQLELDLYTLQQDYKTLEKYKHIPESEAYSNKIMKEADEEAKNKRERAEAAYEKARAEALVIIQNAEKRAEEIAGDAYKAKQNADLYENTVKAMKNIINGYGDEYIKPSHGLLDDLAEEYSFKEAGEELKKARARSKRMIKDSVAASCDYVEQHRKQTAVNFVVDAFNGKVDSALSRVKHDNYGKLEQEIYDAFNVVNYNGKAFRDAAITDEYLKARIDELHWAVKVMVLREEEREEQRLIKEAMREEERARREYEKAIKDAEKEEKLLQQAMDKARKELDAANEEEKQNLQLELDELTRKLQEAEEKNQRALSMAQQTRRGHVYIISNIGSFGENVFKIGLTRRLEPLDRVKELGDASVPFGFDVHAIIPAEDAPALEAQLHQDFADQRLNKVNMRKEFFNVDLISIKEVVAQQNIEAKWTMKAEAQEYRESLALTKTGNA